MKQKKALAAFFLLATYHQALVPSARGATVSAVDEAMVYSGAPNGVWDPKGATEISKNGNTSGNTYPGNIEDALMIFNTSSIVSQLNAQFPTGWTITGVGVTFASNFNTAGQFPNNAVFNQIEPGSFTLSWLSNNGWSGAPTSTSTAVTYNNLANYLPGVSNNVEETEGTFSYLANGATSAAWTLTPTTDMLNDIISGGYLSLFGTPNDSTVGYLINTPMQANPAVLSVTAQAAPEPAALEVLGGVGFMGALLRRRRHSALRSDHSRRPHSCVAREM